MALGKQIKKYRQARGWTLEQLEEASGVPTGTINALENRDSKRSNYAQALAEALGLGLSELLDEATHHQVAEHAAKERGNGYTSKPPTSQPGAVTLQQAINVLAYHMNGLDPPVQAAVGHLLAGLCANPANADKTGRQVLALLSIQGNEQAQKSTSSQAA
jgi:transcriptional regulator with XRE-family HTH domain